MPSFIPFPSRGYLMFSSCIVNYEPTYISYLLPCRKSSQNFIAQNKQTIIFTVSMIKILEISDVCQSISKCQLRLQTADIQLGLKVPHLSSLTWLLAGGFSFPPHAHLHGAAYNTPAGFPQRRERERGKSQDRSSCLGNDM